MGKELEWRAQGDDFRTFLEAIVASLTQVEALAEMSLDEVSQH